MNAINGYFGSKSFKLPIKCARFLYSKYSNMSQKSDIFAFQLRSECQNQRKEKIQHPN